ncbi:TPA: hypothetical protein NQG57_000985 [Salmonella enterica subsp. enterica serovar Infantis]|nr:hypothetical protein [Salmonella enterica subsp. enterica serovar Infantis]HCJ0429053.1 hypothetical protein [Salmonella enterica subsp. enterica serovar Infantis]
MAKQVITIIIEDAKNENGHNGIDCKLNIEAENEAGSYSHLVAAAIGEKFKSIIDVTAEYALVQQERKNRNAITLIGSIH